MVVEVISPSTRQRDEGLERRLYERFGVSEYWTIDPKRDTIAVYGYRDGQYDRVADPSRGKGDTLTTPLLPGLQMPLTEIFAD
jgi:Uma2 family endonuclease